MDSLQTTQLGSFNKNQNISTPNQITSYVDSIVSADAIAFGKNSIANLSSIAIGRASTTKNSENGIAIGFIAEAEDDSGVVVVGAEAKAKDYGTAVGIKSYSNLGVAFGADARALSGHSIALGRYAYVSAEHAIQINGDKDDSGYLVKNDLSGTMMFYNGTKNVTIVDQSGNIPHATVATSAMTLCANCIAQVSGSSETLVASQKLATDISAAVQPTIGNQITDALTNYTAYELDGKKIQLKNMKLVKYQAIYEDKSAEPFDFYVLKKV